MDKKEASASGGPIDGLVKDAVMRMEAELRNTEVQLACLARLDEIAKTTTNRPVMGQLGCVAAIMYSARVNGSSLDLLPRLCATLRTICVEAPPNKKLAMEQGIVPLLLQIMNNHKGVSPVQSGACSVLWVLSFNNPQYQAIIVKVGCLRAIISAMVVSPTDPELQTHGCGALWNLSFKNEENKSLIAHTALAAIIGAMRRHPKERLLQAHACGALNSIVTTNDPTNCFCILRMPGGIAAVQAALKNYEKDKTTVQHASFILKTVTEKTIT